MGCWFLDFVFGFACELCLFITGLFSFCLGLMCLFCVLPCLFDLCCNLRFRFWIGSRLLLVCVLQFLVLGYLFGLLD